MDSLVFLILILCTCTFGQFFDEIFSTEVNTPFCASLLANDNAGTSLFAVENATQGYTYKNYPAFYLGNNSQVNNYTISIDAQNYHVLNYGSTNISSSFLETDDSWSLTTYNSLPVMFVGPDDGNTTNNTSWGIALGYNIAIYHPGVYYVWVYGSSGGNTASDSVHFLVRSPLNDTLNFVSANSPPSSFTNAFIWKSSSAPITVSVEETTWPPAVFNFYIAMREDGMMINQIVLAHNYTSGYKGTTYYSPQVPACDPNTEVLYFPAKDYSGVDTFTYVVKQGGVTYNSTASVYVGVPAPSVSPSATPSRSPSSQGSGAPESSGNRSTTTMAIAIAVGAGGAFLLSACIAGIIIFKRRANKNTQGENKIEMEGSSAEGSTSYQPIRLDLEAQKANEILLEQRRSLKEGGWQIQVKDLKIEYEIGRGAFGVVHKGRWQGIDVAVKHLVLGQDAVDTSKVVDFFAEAELMMKLKGHPNITQLLGVCSDPICLITEFVDNGSLKKYLSTDCTMDVSLQIRVAKDIAAGMLYLHNEGVIHRDLAARNILLDSKMRAKVSDFGMSRVLIDQADGNKTAADVGPIRWMAPEAMRQRLYNKKTDVWSFGVVLYEILTRHLPYHETDLLHIATAVSLGELSLVPDIEKEEHKYPPVLVKILKMCLQMNPQDRPLFENIIEEFDATQQLDASK